MLKKTTLKRRLQRKRARQRELNYMYTSEYAKPVEKVAQFPITEIRGIANTKSCLEAINTYILDEVLISDLQSGISLNKNNNMETTMNIENEKTTYLAHRLSIAYEDKLCEANKFFKIANDQPPCNIKEFKERMDKGWFTFPEYHKEDTHLYEVINYIIWRNPNTPANVEGYQKFSEYLRLKRREAKDRIMIDGPSDGLKALQEFEALEVK